MRPRNWWMQQLLRLRDWWMLQRKLRKQRQRPRRQLHCRLARRFACCSQGPCHIPSTQDHGCAEGEDAGGEGGRGLTPHMLSRTPNAFMFLSNDSTRMEPHVPPANTICCTFHPLTDRLETCQQTLVLLLSTCCCPFHVVASRILRSLEFDAEFLRGLPHGGGDGGGRGVGVWQRRVRPIAPHRRG